MFAIIELPDSKATKPLLKYKALLNKEFPDLIKMIILYDWERGTNIKED